MENKLLCKEDLIDIIDERIDEILLGNTFDFQDYDVTVLMGLYFKGLNQFRDELDANFNDKTPIMTREDMISTLNGMASNMSKLVDEMEMKYLELFSDAVNSVIDFSELI
jgi:hypothetical protein